MIDIDPLRRFSDTKASAGRKGFAASDCQLGFFVVDQGDGRWSGTMYEAAVLLVETQVCRDQLKSSVSRKAKRLM
ncbi:hypothetical protein SAMN07250955_10814 [Arboricoccus pini]|uniref:Uncharacterized protein n=1 Tax=Arboricoccus pini TaxID=1963835 RepID=A0A212RF35_9PROT|nr:hypothetical protein SAMN07250955_10814 [Arboricoccus pini]